MGQKDDTRAPSSGRMDTYRVGLLPRWRADVPIPENRRVRFQCCRDHGDRGMDQLVTVLFTDEYFQRTEESVSNVAEIMEIKAWINRKIDISDCIRLYGASEPLAGLKLASLKQRQLDGYKCPESSLSAVEAIPNKCYCHQDGQPRSPQNINICKGSPLGLKRTTIRVDNGSSACLRPCCYFRKNFQANTLQPSCKNCSLHSESRLERPFDCIQKKSRAIVELKTLVVGTT
ncbi:hypothetical protein TNCV_3533181 [Trichonephila clavipes]|nr:hypothetical protein TNCV_3533181 [Trichonephila clavipes]